MLSRKKSEPTLKLPFNKLMIRPPKILKLNLDFSHRRNEKKSIASTLKPEVSGKDCDLCTLQSTGYLPRPIT